MSSISRGSWWDVDVPAPSRRFFLPAVEVEALIHDPLSANRQKAVSCVGLTREQWFVLAGDHMMPVRRAVAKSRACPTEVLQHLYETEKPQNHSEVLGAVMGNPNTPVDILRGMFREVERVDFYDPGDDEDYPGVTAYSFDGVLDNPNIGEQSVNSLASTLLERGRDFSPKFVGVISNPLLSYDLMREAAKSSDESVLMFLTSNPALPVDVIETLIDVPMVDEVLNMRSRLVERLVFTGAGSCAGWPLEWVESHYGVRFRDEFLAVLSERV